MEKRLKVFLGDNKDWEYHRQEVWCDDCDRMRYTVYDMCDCPEDATIDRDLFSGHEYIKAIMLGIELAKQGYTGIEVEEVPLSN